MDEIQKVEGPIKNVRKGKEEVKMESHKIKVKELWNKCSNE